MEARNNLQRYFKEHKLNPLKSYSKDPVHGKVIRELVKRLNLERAKVMDDYISKDIKSKTKLYKLRYKMAKKEKTVKKAAKKAEEAKPVKKERKVTATKYDYPLIDGREMTKDEKKKYRAEQRKKASGDAPKAKKEKVTKKAEVKAEAKPKAKAKKEKAVEEKPAKKVKKAKAKKVED